jgi:single-strand DNA-binding protein
MQGLNKVMLIGHLGKDPEYITFENGKTLAKCSLATLVFYKDESKKKV